MKEMVYCSVDLGEPGAELETMKENRLRNAVATIHSGASEESSVFILIALGAPYLTKKPFEFEVMCKYLWL
jgi:3-phosphoglycerate kinase